MPKLTEGKLIAKGMKFAIAASRFNDFICGRLIDGAVDGLTRFAAETWPCAPAAATRAKR